MRKASVSIISPTITALLVEAEELEDRAIKLRDVAKALGDLSASRAPIKQPPAGPTISDMPMRGRKAKAAKKTGKKRKYTKRSKFWTK